MLIRRLCLPCCLACLILFPTLLPAQSAWQQLRTTGHISRLGPPASLAARSASAPPPVSPGQLFDNARLAERFRRLLREHARLRTESASLEQDLRTVHGQGLHLNRPATSLLRPQEELQRVISQLAAVDTELSSIELQAKHSGLTLGALRALPSTVALPSWVKQDPRVVALQRKLARQRHETQVTKREAALAAQDSALNIASISANPAYLASSASPQAAANQVHLARQARQLYRLNLAKQAFLQQHLESLEKHIWRAGPDASASGIHSSIRTTQEQ